MWLTFGGNNNGALIYQKLILFLYIAAVATYEGDHCEINSLPGICTKKSLCSELKNAYERGQISSSDIKNCGLATFEELVCCPQSKNKKNPNDDFINKLMTEVFHINPQTTPAHNFNVTNHLSAGKNIDDNNGISNGGNFLNAALSHSSVGPIYSRPVELTRTRGSFNERPAVKACRIIDEGLEPPLGVHIIGGTPVDLGEFPHMAAIGFRRIGDDSGPYEIRCGGTLIASRFVLTAAHCVNSRESQPAIVRLGVTNFSDVDQLRDGVEVQIKEIHIHQNFSDLRKLHDIALLELEYEVNYTTTIYPTCLYTEEADPPVDKKLFVTGWGWTTIRGRRHSDILLKAQLKIESLARCRTNYEAQQVNLISSHLCAHGIGMDACAGDSGGPLNLVVDERWRKYRVVGIIQAGFSCATATPGLYTRVASYLDFIERIVWPESNDKKRIL